MGTEVTISASRLGRIETKLVRHTIADIRLALEITNGNLTEAAKLLGTTRPVLARKVNNYPSLQATLRDLLEQKIDYTEDKLHDLVKEGNVTAITFFLRTRGKDRGYTEKNLLEHGMDPSMRSSAALIEAMRKGTKQIEVKEDQWEDIEE